VRVAGTQRALPLGADGSRAGRHGVSGISRPHLSFEGGVARTTWKVVPGSGTGELAELRGEGGYDAPSGEAAVPYRLDYDLD
jgi:Protein of unknown function (DUF3224)